MTKFVAGFDPGGEGNFGWCLFELTDLFELVDLSVAIDKIVIDKSAIGAIEQGAVDCADQAFDKMKEHLTRKNGELVAAGIDVPLYWARTGNDRKSDKHVRNTSKAGSTVQAANSLKGACLMQGFLLALKIEDEYPNCMITETHPKALLKMNDKEKKYEKITCNEHERDARISAWAAAQCFRFGGKKNLFECDQEEDIYIFLKKTMYWWPK